MVPLLSWRSILVLGLGLLVGSALGLTYWQASPINYDLEPTWPPVRVEAMGLSQTPLYESTVFIEIVGRGSSITSPKTLQRQGEYYSLKFTSSNFLDWLSWELSQQAPQYSHTTGELKRMIKARYIYRTSTPTLRLNVKGGDAQEVAFLAGFIPKAFQTYLLAEDRNIRLEDYQKTLDEMERVRAALLQARKSLLGDLKLQVDMASATLSPAYIAAEAKGSALDLQLTELAATLASLTAQGLAGGQEYGNTMVQMDQVASALAEARKDLLRLRAQSDIQALELNMAYNQASDTVKALDSRFETLSRSVALFNQDSVTSKALSRLVVGEPSAPVVVPPDRIRGRNALMMGIMLGAGSGWVVLNFRGLATQLQAFLTQSQRREEEEEEA